MIGGKKVLREYGDSGKMNAIHLLIQLSQPSVLEFLLSQKIDPDTPDYDQRTPFQLLSKAPNAGNAQSYFNYSFDKLLDMECRIDYPDVKGNTPFLNFYADQKFELAYRMLDMGANVNQMDNSGLFALKYALIRRQN